MVNDDKSRTLTVDTDYEHFLRLATAVACRRWRPSIIASSSGRVQREFSSFRGKIEQNNLTTADARILTWFTVVHILVIILQGLFLLFAMVLRIRGISQTIPVKCETCARKLVVINPKRTPNILTCDSCRQSVWEGVGIGCDYCDWHCCVQCACKHFENINHARPGQ